MARWRVSEYADDRYLTAGGAAWLVRIVLVVGAGAALWYATELQAEARAAGTGPFAIDEVAWRFWAVVGLLFAAGFAFCVAVRFPFPRPLTAWGRVVFVLVALLPAAHAWVALAVEPAGWPELVLGPHWFDDALVVHVGAALAGVAAASAIGARRKI